MFFVALYQTMYNYNDKIGEINYKLNTMENYYYLKKGEIIQEGDECGTMQKYNDEGYTWIKETGCVGELAPDPQYMAHRKYRRLIKK